MFKMIKYNTLIESIRFTIGDNQEEYIFTDEQIEKYIQTAVLEYSKYKPTIRIAEIHTEPNINIYPLPEDYQTWIYGLQYYDIADKHLYINNNLTSRVIKYRYYADRKLFEVPQGDLQLIVDYCFYLMLNNILLNKSSNKLVNTDNISALKLGRGFDLSFDNNQTLEKAIYSFAESIKSNFYNALKNNVVGSWY